MEISSGIICEKKDFKEVKEIKKGVVNMDKLRVVRVNSEGIEFENKIKLYSNHDSDCCESHELYFNDLKIEDFDGLEFDLSNDNFFKRISGYGIELIPINGMSIKIAGHASNNGYYSDNLDLIIEDEGSFKKEYNITDCQIYDDAC